MESVFCFFFLRRKKKIIATAAMNTTGITTPIAAFAPVDSPPLDAAAGAGITVGDIRM